jgi:intracellular multiplication protein IcmG
MSNKANHTVVRNSLIALAVLIFMMVLYKFLGSVFSDKKTLIKPAEVTPSAAMSAPALRISNPILQPTNTSSSNEINQKLSTLETGQQSMRSDVTMVNDTLSGINNNLSTLDQKFSELNSVINRLSDKIDEQAQKIAILTAPPKVKTIRHTVRKTEHYPRYYLQAVIPGRAWLIATNGSTLTVREGNTIAGYGTVKLIDSSQGKVITSSGQIIRFNQGDS